MKKPELEAYRQVLADEARTYGDDLQPSDTRMGTFALAARDAYWHYRGWINRGMDPDDLPADASMFEAWRYSQVDDESFEEVLEPLLGGGMGYFERDLSEQILNASVPQIREYYEYASSVEENADQQREPWEGMGFIHVWLDTAVRPVDVVVSRIFASGHAERIEQWELGASARGPEARAMKRGIREAFEAMLPCLVGGFVPVWQPWLPVHGPAPNAQHPPGPEAAAKALVALRDTDATGRTKLEPGLAYLMTPINFGRFVLDAQDKDFDGEFWAGEIVSTLVDEIGRDEARQLVSGTWLAGAI